MQRIDENKKTFIALVDADGCFYNPIVNVLLQELIAAYSTDIDRIARYSWMASKFLSRIAEMKNFIINNAAKHKAQLIKDGEVFLENSVGDGFKSARYDCIINPHYDASRTSQIKIYYSNLMCAFPELKEVYQALIFAANECLFNFIESRVHEDGHRQVLLMSGSNRQSQKIEAINMLNNGTRSFVFDLSDMSTMINNSLETYSDGQAACYFDPFLMADIYAGKADGHSVGLINLEATLAEDDDDDLVHHDYVFDDTKFTLLYAMLHRAAIKHEEDALTVIFFDDRKDILSVIGRIFKAHPDLIPANVTLECWHYCGGVLNQPASVIEGVGKPDYHFRENVKKIIEICGFSSSQYHGVVDTGAKILADETMSLLLAFKEMRALLNSEQHELSSLFENAFTLFSHPEPRSIPDAAAAAAADSCTQNYHSS